MINNNFFCIFPSFELSFYNKYINIIIPESWYCILKNPAPDNVHPESAKAMASPGLRIGKKVNIVGNDSFSLFPGQMARVIQGHRIRTNQYLLARIYDVDSLKDIPEGEDYYNGKLLVIKGTYIGIVEKICTLSRSVQSTDNIHKRTFSRTGSSYY